jgi:putative transposase
VHLLRSSFKYASRRDWAEIAKDLKPVYTAASEAQALDLFAEFSGKWEKRYPAVIRLWENAWAEFVPFLQFDREGPQTLDQQMEGRAERLRHHLRRPAQRRQELTNQDQLHR